MSPRKSVEHVVLVAEGGDQTHRQAHAKCLRCNEVLAIELPVSVATWLAVNNAFVRVHERCQPREA